MKTLKAALVAAVAVAIAGPALAQTVAPAKAPAYKASKASKAASLKRVGAQKGRTNGDIVDSPSFIPLVTVGGIIVGAIAITQIADDNKAESP